MDFKDRRLWYGVVAVIVVLLVIGYTAGWFGGTIHHLLGRHPDLR